MRPANYVRAIAFLFIALGTWSLLGICVRLVEGQVFPLDLSLLLELWIGFNLLEHRDAARKWALAIAWFLAVGGSLQLLITLNETREMPYFLLGSLAGYVPRSWQFVVLGTGIAVSAMVLLVLHHRATRNLFENPQPRPAWKIPTMVRVGGAVIVIGIPVVLAVRAGWSSCSYAGRPTIHVDIRDSLTNEPIGDGAFISAGKTVHQQDLRRVRNSAEPRPAVVSQPGRYVITVKKDGYRQWVRYRVLVKAKNCELQRVDLTARLQREM